MANAEHAAGQVTPDGSEVPLAAAEELWLGEELRTPAEAPAARRTAAEPRQERYWHLFEFAPVGYVVTDENGRVCKANRAAVRMLNSPAEIPAGEPLSGFVVPEEQGAFRRALARLLSTAGAQEWPMRVQPRRAAVVEVTMTVEAIRDESGAISGVYWIIRDDSGRLEGDLL